MARQEMKPFYQSTAWKAARRAALMRDHYSCQICGARAGEVHHLIELNKDNVKDKNISLNLNNLQSL
jgi:5-methylcytosine-specific restriction endonuclease McrA